MVILINGAFGIGKTTVSRLLSRKLPGSVIFDPEIIGLVLQRGRRMLGKPLEDFQDLPSWRPLFILGVRAAAALRSHVIVPIAISNPSYLREIRDGIAGFEPRVLHFCLVAPVAVVNERIRRRGGNSMDGDMQWQYSRSAECCSVHDGPDFAEQVSTGDLTADEVAEYLLTQLPADVSPRRDATENHSPNLT